MQIERKRISDLNRATYNPRIDLIPGDPEYENLRRSITTYGLLIPVIWNTESGERIDFVAVLEDGSIVATEGAGFFPRDQRTVRQI